MIHKFVLERCVHCNLPLDALEGVGWDCKGHATTLAEDDALWDLDSPIPLRQADEHSLISSFRDSPLNEHVDALPPSTREYARNHLPPPNHLLKRVSQDQPYPACNDTSEKWVPTLPKSGPLSQPTTGRVTKVSRPSTDIFAILAFASGVISLSMMAIVFTPLCFICTIISSQRLKENPNLKGRPYQVIGAVCGCIGIFAIRRMLNSY